MKLLNVLMVTVLSISFVACSGSSGGGSGSKNGPRTGEEINGESSILAQNLADREFCALTTYRTDEENEHFKDHYAFSKAGTVKYFRKGEETGTIKGLQEGTWGANKTHISFVGGGESAKIKAKYEAGTLTLFFEVEGDSELYEEQYEICGGRDASEDTTADTRTDSDTNTDIGMSLMLPVGQLLCGYDDDGNLDGSTVIYNNDNTLVAALENGEQVHGNWSNLTTSQITVSVMGFTQIMSYSYNNGELLIQYTDDGDVETEKYTLCQ